MKSYLSFSVQLIHILTACPKNIMWSYINISIGENGMIDREIFIRIQVQ